MWDFTQPKQESHLIYSIYPSLLLEFCMLSLGLVYFS